MTDISLHGSYGDPRVQAQRANQLSMAHLRVAGQRPAAGADPHAGAVPWSPQGPVPFGWHGADWQHGRSPEETARLRDRFEQFVPRLAGMSGPGRAQEFFADMLPPGATLAPNAGVGYRQAVQHHYDLRKRAGVGDRQGGPYNLPYGGTIGGGGSWGGGAGGVMQQTQRPYQPEFECLTYSTPITMIDGSQLPAGEAARGDSVLGSDGRVYEIKRQAPAGVPEELIDIETWGGEKFTVTTNHRWPAFIWARKCHCGCGEEVKQGRIYKHGCDKHTSPSYKAIPKGYAPVQLVESADLRPGDCLLMPRKFEPIETNVIEDQARLLGYWAAEGSVDRGPLGDYGACFNFGAHEERTWAADVAELLRLEGIDTTMSVHADKGQCRVRTTNDYGRKREETDHTVRWLIDNGGEGAGEKRLSETVMRWPIKLKRALLVGMIRGDGSQFYATTKEGDWTSRSFTVTYTTASPMLARQTALILAQCGFPARVVPVHEPRNRNGWNYRVDVKGGDYPRDLADMVWGEASLSKEHDKSNNVGHACMMDDDFVYVPIKKVTRRPNAERETVYTIAVSAEDQLYCLGAGLSLLTKNSPDRQNYPIHRNLANTFWRLFYKLDALIGNGVDMYAELPWGDFELVGEGVDGEPKKAFERMCEVCNLRSILPYFVKEYLVVGEACPHLFYDDDEGIWTYIGMHNPDQLEVIYTPFIKMDPVVRFKPDHRLQQVLSSTSAMVRAVRETMPPELLSALLSGQYIELSPTNFTFLPRKMHPYDVRGTSILSRMWRPLMYEDCGVAGTPVALPDGTTRPIEDVQVGDTILDRHGRPQKVEAAVEKPPQQPYRISLFGGTKIEVTGTHRWPVWAFPRECQCGCGLPVSQGKSFVRGHVAKNEDVDWKTYGGAANARWSKRRLPAAYEPFQKLATSDLKPGDYLTVPRTFEAVCNNETEEYARLLGYYLAEGSLERLNETDNWGVNFDFHVDEAETWAADVEQICKGLGIGEVKTYTSKGRKGLRVALRRYEYGWLSDKLARDGGRFSHAKKLSEEVMRWPVRLKRQLLIGYLRGDRSAHVRIAPTRSVTASCTTVSDALAAQLWFVCAQVGWPITHRCKTRHASKDGRKRRLRNEMSFKGPWADDILREVFGIEVERGTGPKGPNAWSKVWMDDDFVYYPIKKIEQRPDAVPVFGLTVANDRSYTMHGFGTYNSIFNASIATARRHAGPIKVAKLGDRTTGWIPDPSHEQRLLELLAQAELDPHAWLIYHYGIEFDMVGTTDRVMTIDKHWDLIERIKLIAMGISKAFLHGEVTYASAASGLTVFLQRLKNLRQFFENAWIYPKFFRPVAEMNEWVKPTAAEAASASPKGPYIKTRRSRRELIEDDRYIVPTLEWDRQLDPSVESAQITAVQALQGMGVIFSKQYLSSLVGRDWEEEINQRAREAKIEQQILANNPGLQAAMIPAGPGGPGGGLPGGPPPGGGGADIMPGLPPEVMGFEPEPGAEGPGGGGAPGAGEAGVHAAPGESGAPSGGFWTQPQMWSRDGQHGGWDESVVQDLVRVIRDSEDPEEDLWIDMLKDTPELKSYLGDPDLSWELVDDWLHRADVGYPPAEILTLEDILKRQGVLAGGEVLIAPKAGRKPRRKGHHVPSDALLVGVK